MNKYNQEGTNLQTEKDDIFKKIYLRKIFEKNNNKQK